MTTDLRDDLQSRKTKDLGPPDPDGAAAVAPRSPRSRRSTLALLVLALLLVAGGYWYRRSKHDAASGAGAAGAAAGDRVIPVTVAQVETKDLPVYLEGLGTAVPLATVTVRSQVDGRLDAVQFTEGQKVKKGDLLAQIDPRPFLIQLHTAQAALERDASLARNAALNLDRYETLRKQNLISVQQVSDQQALADQAQATSKSDQAQIESARLNLDYARIVSPIEGVAGVRQVDPGNLVHAADATGIVVLTQLDPMAVIFTLPQDDLGRVATELAKGPLEVLAFSRDGTQKLGTGRVTFVDNQINQTTSTIRLKATFPNPDRALWPNAFVKARMLLSTMKGAVVVPAPALQRGPQGTFVYVVGPEQTAAMRPVEVDVTTGDFTVIARGVHPGEQVVTDGQNQLRPGSKVAPRRDQGGTEDPGAATPGRAAPAGGKRGAGGPPGSGSVTAPASPPPAGAAPSASTGPAAP